MGRNEPEDTREYKVVVNHEEQYSIWPADRENPAGWANEGMRGNKQACLDHIAAVWKDMRPLSLRKRMDELARQRESDVANIVNADSPAAGANDDLVSRLCNGDHPVELVLRPAKTREVFEQNLARRCVHIKFTETRGGTELDVNITAQNAAKNEKDLAQGNRTVRLEGSLTLNYVNVNCVAEINTQTFTGVGRLEIVEDGRYSQV